MTARWQVSTVLALEGRPAPHPGALAQHVGDGLVACGADDDVLTLVARVPGRSADEAVRELSRRLAPLALAQPRRRRGLHVQRVRRLAGSRRTPLLLAWSSDGDDDGSAGDREPRRPRTPLAPAAQARPLPR